MVPLRKLTGDFRQPAKTALSAPAAASKALASSSLATRSARAGGKAGERANLLIHSALLSGIAGYVDAAGFVSLVGLFPAHLTGELVGDAIALSSGHATGHGAGHAHLWAFPVFVGAVILATLVARVFRHLGLKARAGLLALVTLALALFSVSDALAWLLHEGQLPLLVRGGFAVAAMGFQSALMRESLTGSCPTTVMTGNLTQVVIDLVDHVVGRVTHSILPQHKAPLRLTPVAGSLFVFALSAVLGGWLARLYGSVSVALPTALAAALMFQAWSEDIAGRMSSPPEPVQEGAAPRPVVVGPGAKESLAQDWPSEPYSIDLASETRIKAEPVFGEHKAPLVRPEPVRPVKKRSVSGLQRIRR
ncbi:MAG: YoaK family protein [Myxococcales bacterium]